MSLSEQNRALIERELPFDCLDFANETTRFDVLAGTLARLLDAARAEGVAALQQAAVEALRQIAALEPETMLSAYTDRYSGERTAYRTLDYEQVQEIVAAALPQQTALVEPYSPDLDDVNGRLA